VTKARDIRDFDTILVFRGVKSGHEGIPADEEGRRLSASCLQAARSRWGSAINAAANVPNGEMLLLTNLPNQELPREGDGHGGRVCDMVGHANAELTRVLNELSRNDDEMEDRKGAMWDPEDRCKMIPLRNSDDILSALALVCAFPAITGWVEDPSDWEGLATLPADIGLGCMAEIPVLLKHLDRDLLVETVAQRARALTRVFHEHRRRCAGCSPDDHPFESPPLLACLDFLEHQSSLGPDTSPPPLATAVFFLLTTITFQSTLLLDGAASTAFGLGQLRSTDRRFLARYECARVSFKKGDREVEYPWGTYWQRWHIGVNCPRPPPAPPPAPS